MGTATNFPAPSPSAAAWHRKVVAVPIFGR